MSAVGVSGSTRRSLNHYDYHPGSERIQELDACWRSRDDEARARPVLVDSPAGLAFDRLFQNATMVRLFAPDAPTHLSSSLFHFLRMFGVRPGSSGLSLHSQKEKRAPVTKRASHG